LIKRVSVTYKCFEIDQEMDAILLITYSCIRRKRGQIICLVL
jgi:hypothetical protein